jgi:HEPN domain-containing protein/predicted nucleotidyltransferase
MKKSLSHLPKHKREEIYYITEFIRSKSKYADMLILFGSYARGDWVEDTYVEDGVTYEYKSDYDILVISENETIAGRYRYWYELAQKAARGPVNTRITIIAHDIEHVNNSLKKGQYFFTDIKKEGILLYDSGKFKLARKRKLDPKQRAGMAKRHFEEWFKSGEEFYEAFEHQFEKGHYKNAAFQLHQAAESFYKTVLLVFTNYRPKGHYLDSLSSTVCAFSPKFLTVFPMATDEQKRCFDLLNEAYVRARYDSGYKITKEQLEYLASRVKVLQRLTKTICQQKIKSWSPDPSG